MITVKDQEIKILLQHMRVSKNEDSSLKSQFEGKMKAKDSKIQQLEKVNKDLIV